MTRKLLNSSTLLLLALVSACASVAGKYKTYNRAKPSSAVVYIYRPGVMSGMIWSHEFKLDGARVGALSGSTYLPLELAPGKHKITLNLAYEDVNEIDFDARSGETYYLRSNQDIPNLHTRFKFGSTGVHEACRLGRAVSVSVLEEKLKEMDTRVQTSSCAPSLMFVIPAHALPELESLKRSLD